MVAVRLNGGIGNQLFIYTAARALAQRLGTEVVLNTSKGFVIDFRYHRTFELAPFQLSYLTDPILTFDYRGSGKVQELSRRIGRNFFRPGYVYLKDNTDNTSVDDRFFKIKSKNVFLEGFWQSPMYFQEYEQLIRQDLSFPADLELKLKDKIGIIKDCSARTHVCMGVRRYQECVDLGRLVRIDEDYYLKAMDYVSKYTENTPMFHIYTQDVDWVKKHIVEKTDFDIVIEQERSTIEDLCLMSKYHYHIISNSTFYWWGAWLADGKMVVTTDKFINKHSNLSKWIII